MKKIRTGYYMVLNNKSVFSFNNESNIFIIHKIYNVRGHNKVYYEYIDQKGRVGIYTNTRLLRAFEETLRKNIIIKLNDMYTTLFIRSY